MHIYMHVVANQKLNLAESITVILSLANYKLLANVPVENLQKLPSIYYNIILAKPLSYNYSKSAKDSTSANTASLLLKLIINSLHVLLAVF